jgi:hypothetical protein
VAFPRRPDVRPAGAARRAEIEKAIRTELQTLVRPFSRALAEMLMPWAVARQ